MPTLRSWPSPVNCRGSSGTSAVWRCRLQYRTADRQPSGPASQRLTYDLLLNEFPEDGVARYSSNPRNNPATDIADLRLKTAVGSRDGPL
ncbi:hypothetical protein CBM2598_U10071 [Cupriavidus taiwanensis]|uniref:Uncharacterized protein n=1 Tax=Cupriavidus taiwanensis TaxID=164546 RepID=A0A7Z7JI17_9BURK|nr:hypothetical protein CBM2597_U10279 [Cupriavidus taiwanensis]SOZ96250.1 hypothetical protein CBM2598_U10071 [Cupriavidus taiwanensis]SPC25784.1 hypothetical protein CBM2594_U10285 [Cupriavidus taiwanensis]